MTLIYLASPYASPDPAIRDTRAGAVAEAVAALMRSVGVSERQTEQAFCDPNGTGLEIGKGITGHHGQELQAAVGTDWWATEPAVDRVAHGVANRMDNGQVSIVAATAWEILTR